MGTTLSKNYAHLWADFYKGIDEQGPFYETAYKFDDWADGDDIANELAGKTYRSGSTTTRVTPHQHPLSPNLYCSSVRIEGVGRPVLRPSGLPYYAGGFIARVTYRVPVPVGQFNPADDPANLNQIDATTPILWCTQELDSTVQLVTLPNHQYTYQTSFLATGIPMTLRVGITVMRLTFHQLPFLPTKILRDARNKVNSTTFLGCDPGYVLFDRYSTARDFGKDGSVTQRVTMEFHEREQAWNKVPKKDSLTVWDYAVDGAGGMQFQSFDLNTTIQGLY